MSCEQTKLCLFPPQNVTAELSGRYKKLRASIKWDPPVFNGESVGGYLIERTNWWPGKKTRETIITKAHVKECEFVDDKVKADVINEYRVFSTHVDYPEIRSLPSFPAAVYGFAYARYDDVVRELKELAAENQDICRLIDAGPALGNFRLWCVVLGEDKSDRPDKPGIFFHANAHSAENQCTDTCLGIIRESIKRYRENDKDFLKIFENVQIRITPIYNPYGRSCVEKGFPGRARFAEPVTRLPAPVDPLDIEHCWPADMSKGLDPNRNFDILWDVMRLPDGQLRSIENWGAKPFALPQTKALAKLAKNLRPQISIDFHAPCSVPFYPGKWPDGSSPVDEELVLEVSRKYAELSSPAFSADIAELSSIPYDIPPGWGTGWFYKEFYGVNLCLEGFHEQMPGDSRLLAIGPSESLKELIPNGVNALKWLGKRVLGAGVTVYVKDEKGRPLSAEVHLPGHMDEHCALQESDADHGVCRRLLAPGTYTLLVRRDGYRDEVLDDLIIEEDLNKTIRVTMKRIQKDKR